MKSHFLALLLPTAVLLPGQTPPQFGALLTNSTDYTCGGAPHCATWPSPAVPPAGGIYRDPTWGTTTTRIPAMTKCLMDTTHTTSCDTRNFFPDYSKQQPWNADGTKLLLLDAQGWYHVYDAVTLTDLARISDASGLCCDHDVRWSHSDPNLLYFVTGMSLKSYNISTHALTTIHTFSCLDLDGVHTCDLVRTRDEGNSSEDDRYWALVGTWYGNAATHTVSVIVYDRQTDTVVAQKPVLTVCGGDCKSPVYTDLINWVGMSPSGNYVIVQWNRAAGTESAYDRPMGTEVFNRSLTYLGKATAGHAHGDVGYDVHGREVYVSSWNLGSHPYNTLRWTRLDTFGQGAITMANWDWGATFHISMRATVGQARGWALVSSYFNNVAQGTGFGASEMMAVQVDTDVANNTAGWRRIGRTFSIKSEYYAEPHAVPNQDFTKILWGSNWITPGGQIMPFQITLKPPAGPPVRGRWMITGRTNR